MKNIGWVINLLTIGIAGDLVGIIRDSCFPLRHSWETTYKQRICRKCHQCQYWIDETDPLTLGGWECRWVKEGNRLKVVQATEWVSGDWWVGGYSKEVMKIIKY